MLLPIKDVDLGIQEYRIDLNQLFPDKPGRDKFEERWLSFYQSDPTHPIVYSRAEKDKLIYRSESFIPTKTDDRPALLLVLGNPASHSVASGMCFAYEGQGREHRFWRGLREAQLLDFDKLPSSDSLPEGERSHLRKRYLFDLDYTSPFRIGITVFYSLPSPASKAWSGISGIRKLFGGEAFNRITEAEQGRVSQVVRSFIPQTGAIMAFQRDAYEAVRQTTDTPYSLDLAISGKLIGRYRDNPTVLVMGVAPTRLMLAGKVIDSLVDYAGYLEAALDT